MLKHVKVFVLDLLTLGAFLAEVHELSVLFRALDRLEELAACIGCFRNQIRRIVVNALLCLVISHEIEQILVDSRGSIPTKRCLAK